MSAHDRWLAGYRIEEVVMTCRSCGGGTSVTLEHEYGCSTATPAECPDCGVAWDGSEDTEPDEPDEDRIYDRHREDADEMGERR